MTLIQPAFHRYPITAISPRGWLADQLRIQADGLSGHLDEFWPDIRDSAWIGGKADGWERMPYWLDGVITLAWLLDDALLKERINGYVHYIVTHQQADGWLGPRVEQSSLAADVWSQFLALKMLIVYHDASGDTRIVTVVDRALRMLDRHIDSRPLSQWAQFRWFECLIAVWWLHDRTGENWLLDLAVKLQAQGFHWRSFFDRWPLTERTKKGGWNFAGHVVNNAMAIKAGALWWRLTGDDADRDAVARMISLLDRHHGMPTGVFTGDECLAGTSAIQGTELCAVVEYMYSLECLAAVLGDPAYSDRLERIAFNALPATFSPDMWSHQYDQQVNQIECSVRENRIWTTNGRDANIYGLEPNFGCCTANLSQGWPKFAASLWMRPATGGIAAVAYAPSRLETAIRNVAVRVELETDYPFGDELRYTVSTAKRVDFPLLLRIPAWADGPTADVDGRRDRVERVGDFHAIERAWSGETSVVLTLPAAPRIIHRPGNNIAISRGPLVYALKIGEDWRQINEDKPYREPPHADWEVRPATPWNYAVDTSDETIAQDIAFTQHAIVNPVFSPEHAPITAVVNGRRVPAWSEENGSAGPTPTSPFHSDEPIEELVLIPYGCTSLRIAEFPVLERDRST